MEVSNEPLCIVSSARASIVSALESVRHDEPERNDPKKPVNSGLLENALSNNKLPSWLAEGVVQRTVAYIEGNAQLNAEEKKEGVACAWASSWPIAAWMANDLEQIQEVPNTTTDKEFDFENKSLEHFNARPNSKIHAPYTQRLFGETHEVYGRGRKSRQRETGQHYRDPVG